MNQMLQVGNAGLSLELPKSQTFEEWVETGKSLASASRVLSWWIGDWWAAGSHRYGQRAKVAAEGIFGREFGTLANLASVCRAFTTSRRHEVLSFTHHQEVASLSPEVADELLQRAERDSWTVRDIRAEASLIRRSELAPHPPRDAEALEWSALVGAWNRARYSVRQQFVEEMDGTEAIEK